MIVPVNLYGIFTLLEFHSNGITAPFKRSRLKDLNAKQEDG